MKKYLLLSTLLMSVVTFSALAEKVTYEQAVKDSDAYLSRLPNHPTSHSALPPRESSSTGGRNQMGVWVKLGSSSLLNAGQYSNILSPSAVGKACLKGSKGWVSGRKSVCDRTNSGGWMCQSAHLELDMKHGYKAECR